LSRGGHMKVIYQIGRFERGGFNPLKFEINGKVYQSYLSSLALRQHFKDAGSQAKVILIYPVSILLNRPALSSEGMTEDFRNLVQGLLMESSKLEDYLRNPYPYFAEHPHSKEADSFIVIHSIGQYEGVNFLATLEELILETFVGIVSHYHQEPFSELYLDVSSGHNIYTTALLEAGRLFLICYNLQNPHVKDEEKLKVYITFSEPIVQPFDRIFKVFTGFPLEVKTFFSFPQAPDQYSFDGAYMKFSQQLTGEDRKMKRFFNELFARGYFFYSALKNNTPLVLYSWDYDQEDIIDEGIRKLTELIKTKLRQHYRTTPGLSLDPYRKGFIMLSLYKGIVKILKDNAIVKKEEVSVYEIKEKFCRQDMSIYNYFDLQQNSSYLSHEIDVNFEKNKERFSDEWKLLKDYMNVYETQSFNDRNFLAHCGFERNCILVKKVNADVVIKYDENLRNYIERCLLRK